MPKLQSYDDDQIQFHYSIDKNPKQTDFVTHTHEHCELYYFISGKGIFKIEGNEYHLRTGDVLIMRPTESHFIEVDENVPYARAALHFKASLFSNIDPEGVLLKSYFDREAGRFNLFHSDDFQSENYRIYLDNMLKDSETKRTQLISSLIPLLNEIYQVHKMRKDEEQSAEENIIYRIVNYINRHLYEPVSLTEISEKFYISKPQLCRSFKKSTGSSVWEYITVKRLFRAKDLLRSGISPTSAAEQCGFNDYSAFYRAYVKKFGMSPQKDALSNKKQ